MDPELSSTRHSPRQKGRLWWWAAVGAAGFALFLVLYPRAFPEAKMDIRVGRAEALELARSFLDARGYDLTGCREAVCFSGDEDSKSFLEKALGSKGAERLMERPVNIWYWFCRFFTPGQEEEYRAAFSPQGGLVYFSHIIPETAPGASVQESEALGAAESFLRDVVHQDLTQYDRIGGEQIERPNRLDYRFTWKRRDIDVDGATYRFYVAVQGDAVGGYGEHLDIPETAQRQMATEAARRGALMQAAGLMNYALNIAVAVVFFLMLRFGHMRWRFGAAAASLLVALIALSYINNYPLSWLSYPTTQSERAFIGGQFLEFAGSALSIFLRIGLLAMAADALGRMVFPRRAPVSLLFSPQLWRSREFMTACIVGGGLAMLHAAYVSIFYLAGEQVGVWVPLDWPYNELLSTPMPWLEPLTTGLWAALREELLYRLFAIALLLRLTRTRWLAVTLPAILWGFLHSNYPQDPIYIRGLELTLVGVVYGMVFLRYGFFATFISHYTYNALASGLVLVRSENLYFRISGIVVIGLMFLPALPGLWALMRGRRLLDAEALITSEQDTPPHLFGKLNLAYCICTYAPYKALSRRALRIAAVCAIAGAVILALIPIQPPRSWPIFEVNRWQAGRIADSYAESQGIPVNEYRRVIHAVGAPDFLDEESNEWDYLYQHASHEEYERLVRDYMQERFGWSAYYMRPGDPQSYGILVSRDGRVESMNSTLPEEAPGARLSAEEAQSIAEAYLRDVQGIDLAQYQLATTSTREQPNRTDHYFFWDSVQERVADAPWRLGACVQGDAVRMYYPPELKVPDEWLRLRSEEHLRDKLLQGLAMALGTLLVLGVLLLCVRFFMLHTLDWRVTMAAMALVFVVWMAMWLNALPVFWEGASPNTPPMLYAFQKLSGGALSLFGAVAVSGGLAAFCDAAFLRAYPGVHPLMHWFGVSWQPDAPGAPPSRLPLCRAWGEAIVTGLSLALALAAAFYVVQAVEREMLAPMLASFEPGPDALPKALFERSVHEHAPLIRAIGGFDCTVPAIEMAGKAIYAGAGAGFLLLLGAAAYKKVFKARRWPLHAGYWTLAALLMGGNIIESAKPLADAAASCILAAAVYGILYVGLTRFLRDRLAAYFVCIATLALLAQMLLLRVSPDTCLQANCHALAAVLCFLFILGSYWSKRREEF